MYKNFSFTVDIKDPNSNARIATIKTPHGTINTPNFIFCATKAAIKGLETEELKELGVDIILSNTYHLMLNPGGDWVEKMGGLHNIMGWQGPILTDSGGYQIFSFGYGSVSDEIKGKKIQGKKNVLKIDEKGAEFASYLDGQKHLLTPELSMKIQKQLGADLVVTLDECTPFNIDKKYTEDSLHMSNRWAERFINEFEIYDNGKQAIYSAIQGGIYNDLRTIAADFVNNGNFFGHALGGCLGNTKQQMYDIVEFTTSLLRKDRPIHLLGIGGLIDIWHGVRNGIDTFDCVYPTRLARHAGALVKQDITAECEVKNRDYINLSNKRFREDKSPIDPNCSCKTCRIYSRAYLNYLIRAKEMIAIQAITRHNIFFMSSFMQEIRNAIKKGELDKVRKEWITNQ